MLIKIGDCLVDPAEILAVQEQQPFSHPDGPLLTIVMRGLTPTIVTDTTLDEAEAALIDAGLMEGPEEEEEEDVIVLTPEDYRVLDQLRGEGYQYLARDDNGKLYAYRNRPRRHGSYWDDDSTPDHGPKLIEEGFATIGTAVAYDIHFLLIT